MDHGLFRMVAHSVIRVAGILEHKTPDPRSQPIAVTRECQKPEAGQADAPRRCNPGTHSLARARTQCEECATRDQRGNADPCQLAADVLLEVRPAEEP